jgi:hypothetical protein
MGTNKKGGFMMRNTCHSDIKRALSSKGFLAGTLGMVIIISLSLFEGAYSVLSGGGQLEAGYHVNAILDILPHDLVILTAPILCTLPFTTAYVDDMQSGFIKQFLPRCGIKKYILGKLWACAISGGLVLSAGILLSYILSGIFLAPMESVVSSNALATQQIPKLLGMIGMFFFSGAFWSLVGFVLASMTNNRYMAYASPFIVFYILIILHERYFNTLYSWYPKEWLNPSASWMFGNWGVIILLSELIILISLGFSFYAGRKLGHE